jgi:hypothetical protein
VQESGARSVGQVDVGAATNQLLCVIAAVGHRCKLQQNAASVYVATVDVEVVATREKMESYVTAKKTLQEPEKESDKVVLLFSLNGVQQFFVTFGVIQIGLADEMVHHFVVTLLALDTLYRNKFHLQYSDKKCVFVWSYRSYL